MRIVIKLAILLLECIYFILKRLPQKDKILYISRQGDDIPVDFQLLAECMKQRYPEFQNIFLCKMIQGGVKSKLGYCFHMCRQMYHLATAKAVVLDGYCILACVLTHRANLVIIQMWHALGALKKFGYSILDRPEGKSSKIAKTMKMHNNYSFVFTSGDLCKQYFAEAFNQPIDKVKVFPLPRVDLLLDEEHKKKIAKSIYDRYPQLKNTEKKILVYTPTFRENSSGLKDNLEKLIEKIDYKRYELIVKLHPLSDIRIYDSRIITDKNFSATDMLVIADYVITDYSAIIFEALLLDKPIALFAFDYKDYCINRDFYLDYESCFNTIICPNIEQLFSKLQKNEEYDFTSFREFIKKIVRNTESTYTGEICEFIYENIKQNEK